MLVKFAFLLAYRNIKMSKKSKAKISEKVSFVVKKIDSTLFFLAVKS